MSAGRIITIADHPSGGRVEDEADVVIIGTGPGGATAARVLAEAGVDVILVEEGRPWPREARSADAWSSFKGAWRDASMQVARGRAFWPVLQGCAVGGTTPINGAIIHRMPEQIHAAWCERYGVGDVLAWERLTSVYDRLDDELGVAPAPESRWGQNNDLFRRGAESMGMVSNPIRRCVRDCKGTSRCTQGCPSAAKQSMDVTFIPYAMERGARVYATCRVERVMMRGRRATGVRARFRQPTTGETGAAVQLHARHGVIVAAGAIHTPLLLMGAGTGRPSGQVGRGLMCHPGSSVLGVFEERVNMWYGATQGYESTHYWDEGMKFEVVGVPPAVAAARLPGYGQRLMGYLGEARHITSWGVQIRARTVGRVRRGFGGRPAISYDLVNQDVALLKLGLKRLVHMAFGAGAKRVLMGVHGMPEVLTAPEQADAIDALPNDPRLFHAICAHLFGTAAIGATPETGVVREDGSVWDAEGLYVMDASVLPTNMGVNPQHTICAASWLMAERLADRIAGA